MAKSDHPLALAGDIGGTHTRLGLFRAGKRRPRLETEETFSSIAANGLEEIIDRFIGGHKGNIGNACFGIAGPVQKGRSKTTNLPWEVVGSRIQKRFNFQRVRLINDVASTIHAVPLLKLEELVTLNRGSAVKEGALGLVAPGTGLGQALMVWVDGRAVPIPTEGGHVDFAPTNEREMDLWRYLSRRFRHVSVERVVSGPGLSHIYSWLRESSGRPEPGWLSRALNESEQPKVITDAALNGKDQVCSEALDFFVSILGAVAGNLALGALTVGGVYLGGGIPPKILPRLEEGPFMKGFTNKGRFEDLVSRIPVHVILNDKAALLGAAECALSSP